MKYVYSALALIVSLSVFGCGGGSDNAAAPPSSQTPTPAAKFTAAEISGKTIYAATPSNLSGTFDAITFNSDGTTVTESLNLTTTSTSSASATLTGSYSIDSGGVLTITLSGKTSMQAWKTSAAADGYDSFNVVTSYNTALTQRWFYDQTVGATQALACAKGTTIPPLTSNAAFPFNAGTTWTYTQGSTTIVKTVLAGGATPKVQTAITTNGATTTTTTNYKIVGTALYEVNAANTGVDVLDQPDQFAVGYSVRFNTSPFDFTYNVLTNETVSVPAGSFPAWKYTVYNGTNTASVDTYWYSPSVGTVKAIDNQGVTTQLVSYTIK